jgi:hypothetical protein
MRRLFHLNLGHMCDTVNKHHLFSRFDSGGQPYVSEYQAPLQF